MSPTVTRLALLQVLTILYCVVWIGTVLKVRYGSPPPQLFATYLCHYGVFLLVIPLLWCGFAVVEMHKPRVDSGDGLSVVGSGVGLLVALTMLAFFGTIDASIHHSLVIKIDAQRPAALTSRLEKR